MPSKTNDCSSPSVLLLRVTFDAIVESTRKVNEDVYLDLDAESNVVSMTIEHARRNTRLPDIVLQEFDPRRGCLWDPGQPDSA